MRRFFAWAGLFFVFAAFMALLVMTFTGAPANAILALLLCLIITPVLIYALLCGTKMFSRKKEENE